MKESQYENEKRYIKGFIDYVVLINSLHEGTDTHHEVRELFTGFFGTLHRLPDITIQSILRTVVGQNTIDKLILIDNMKLPLSYHKRQSFYIEVTRMKEEEKTYVFTVHIKDDHIISINTIQESLNACK